MPTLTGSPTRSTNNAFLERYVRNVSPEKPLTPISPSKMNSSAKLEEGFKPSISLKAEKENMFKEPSFKVGNTSVTSPMKLAPYKTERTLQTATIRPPVDISGLSNNQKSYYEFLCRVGEVKRWIEKVTGETLPNELDLCVGDSFRNGVYLAILTQKINPELAPTIYAQGEKLQFKHTQNINAFFSLVDHVGLPESFRFELQDLYNKKDLPQVFETLYILITIINKKWPMKTPPLESLSGQLAFSQEDLKTCQRAWPRIRDFKSLSVSPIGSPSSKRVGITKKPGLIEDFGSYDKMERNSSPNPSTPTKSIKTSAPPQLSPPSQTPALFSSPKTTTDLSPKSPSRIPSFKTVDHDILSRTPHLEYSPIRNSTLSYYSPTISKYLTYDTDFYMRRSQARESDVEFYQTHKYGPIDYSPKRRHQMTEEEFLDQVLKIQGTCRAVNIRFDLYIQRNLLKLFGKEILLLQSYIRAQPLRSRPVIQSILSETSGSLQEITSVQAYLRGQRNRNILDNYRLRLLRQEPTIENLQMFSKGLVTRRKAHQLWNNICSSDVPLRKLQSVLKGLLQRSVIGQEAYIPSSQVNQVKNLQGLCRGILQRKARKLQLRNLDASICSVLYQFQSIVRGNVRRESLDSLVNLLEYQTELIGTLSACLRGRSKRRTLERVGREDYEDIRSLNCLQGVIRGVLVRYTLDLVDDIIEYNDLHHLQSRLKGYVLRSRLLMRSSMFRRNARSIVLIQSTIRMHLQRKAYLELMECPNPTIWSVRKFCPLLNNIGTIEEAQNKLEGSQAQLDSENSRKEKLEKDIRQQLDMLEVLESYDLQTEYSGDSNEISVPRRRYPTFEKLFYLLQVDPSYWALVYSRNPDFFLRNVYVTFSTVNQKMRDREKMLFVRLLVEILKLEISEALTIEQFSEKQNAVWMVLLNLFLQREYPELFNLFVPLLKFIADPKTQFESNPSVIYRGIHGVHAASSSTAVEDQSTSATFINNLQNIWHSIELLSMLFSKQLSKIPLEVRLICTKLFCSAADKNADENETLKAISVVLINCFSAEYLRNRAHYGFNEASRGEVDQKIEVLLSASMKVFSGSRFTGYHDPLNAYAQEITVQVKELLFSVLLDPQYEQEGECIIYQDMISANPQLEILGEKVLMITSEFQENLAFFPDEDIIHDILKKVPDPNATPPTGRVVLDLTPTVYRFLVSDDRTRKLYDQVKRAFIYMMQIEDVSTDLYDLALSCVLPQDEPRFQALVNSNRQIQNDPMIQSLVPSNYFDLKNSTLKKIHELENMGTINPAGNRLQNFLNDIANTIKNPHYAIDYVTQELYVTNKTLNDVSKINQSLESALSQQKMSINRAFQGIQQSRSFESNHKSTLGNLKDAYKKVQHRKGNELEGLKFKWSTRQLYEKGVIKSITGERLAEQKIKVFGSSGPKFPDITFKISTSDGVKYGIQLLDKRKGPEKRHSESVDSFSLKGLLQSQVGTKVDDLSLFGGKVHANTRALLSLIVSAFLKAEVQM